MTRLTSLFLIFSFIPLFPRVKAEEVNEILVTGESTADQVSSSRGVTTISIPDDGAGQTIADVLEKDTSLRVRRYGGLGSYSTLSIRGSTPAQVNFYIDGVPVTGAYSGEMNLSDLSVNGVEKIEVTRSGVPGLPGGSAIGGTVNIITKKTGGLEGGYATLNAGSFHTAGMGAGYRTGQEFQCAVDATGEVSDQDYTYLNDHGTTFFNKWDDTLDKRKNAYYRTASGNLKMGGRAGATSISFLNNSEYRMQGVPGPGSNQFERTKRKHLSDLSILSTDTRGWPLDALRLETRSFYRDTLDNFYDPDQEFSYGNPGSKTRDQRYGAYLIPSLILPDYHQDMKITMGLEREIFHRENRDELDQLSARVPTKFRNTSLLQWEDAFHFIDERIHITPAIAYEKHVDRYNDDSTSSRNTALIGSNRSVHQFTAYRLDASALFFKSEPLDLSVRTTISTEWRMPNFLEIFGERGRVTGNTELKPERSRNAEGGLEVQIHWSFLKMNGSLIGFQRTVKDMILLVPVSMFTVKPENIDAADIRGVEGNLKSTFFNAWSVDLSYTYQKATNQSSVSYLKGKYLPLQPLHEFRGGITYRNERYLVGYEGVFIGALFLDRTNEYSGYRKSRWIHNLYASYKFTSMMAKPLTLKLAIRNIGDSRVEDVSGYPLPGRSFTLSLRQEF